MRVEDILATFKKSGKPQTAAIYRRHGSGNDVYGVLTSEIAKLAKRIGSNPELAAKLWKTGNAEARILSLLVSDPADMSRADLENLVGNGPVRFVGCYLADLASRTATADATMRAWMKSTDENRREMGCAPGGPLEG